MSDSQNNTSSIRLQLVALASFCSQAVFFLVNNIYVYIGSWSIAPSEHLAIHCDNITLELLTTFLPIPYHLSESEGEKQYQYTIIHNKTSSRLTARFRAFKQVCYLHI